jgi:hypothetical protein
VWKYEARSSIIVMPASGASDSCEVCMDDRLFQSEEFGTSSPATATVIFVCPYSAPIQKVRFAIRRLLRAGHHVVAYQTTTAVFTAADPVILPELISEVREDIRSRISRLTAEGVTEFGFFGSSLGSFILYNCIGREIPELRWGVFNTGGNIARGVWNMPALRQRHVERGWSLPRLEEAWAKLQWPDFGRLDDCRFVFAGSRRDRIAPLCDISHYLGPMFQAGAEVSVYEVPAMSHRTAVIAGLWKGPQLVQTVRATGPATGSRSAAVVIADRERPHSRRAWSLERRGRSRTAVVAEYKHTDNTDKTASPDTRRHSYYDGQHARLSGYRGIR